MLLQKELGGECSEHWNCKEWLVCQDGVCSACESNSQCQERNPSRQCFSALDWAIEGEISGNICKHKPLFFPLTWSDGAIALVTFLTIALAAPTGTGGGGILVPMYMIIGEFAAHSAVPLSKATILGGAIANNVINLQRRHPFANRPIVDFDAIQLLVPNLLAGTIFGVFLNAVSPDWLITVGLVIALGYSGFSAGCIQSDPCASQHRKLLLARARARCLPCDLHLPLRCLCRRRACIAACGPRCWAGGWGLTVDVLTCGVCEWGTANKAWGMYAEEVRHEERETQPLMGGVSKQRELPARHYSFDTEDNLSKDMYEIVDAESKTNFKAFGVVAAAWLLVFTCSFVKGGSGTHALVPCGSAEFFVVAFLPVPIILVMSWRVGSPPALTACPHRPPCPFLPLALPPRIELLACTPGGARRGRVTQVLMRANVWRQVGSA